MAGRLGLGVANGNLVARILLCRLVPASGRSGATWGTFKTVRYRRRPQHITCHANFGIYTAIFECVSDDMSLEVRVLQEYYLPHLPGEVLLPLPLAHGVLELRLYREPAPLRRRLPALGRPQEREGNSGLARQRLSLGVVGVFFFSPSLLRQRGGVGSVAGR